MVSAPGAGSKGRADALAASYSAAKNALKTLYDGTCIIHTLRQVRDAETGIVRGREIPAADAIPCRLSYAAARPADPGALGAPLSQTAMLFTAPENAPPEGSRVLVTHRSRTTAWTASGPPALYPTHAQTPLALEQIWA